MKILLALALCGPLLAATHIHDTLLLNDGATPMAGKIYVLGPSGGPVAATSQTVTIGTGGVVDFNLVGCTGCTYKAQYQLTNARGTVTMTFTETWAVPDVVATLTRAMLQGGSTTPAGLISPQQISGAGLTAGQAWAWNGTAWVPGSATSIDTDASMAANSDAVVPSQKSVKTALAGKVGTSDSRLSDARTPTAHAGSHAAGQADAVTPAAIGALPLHGKADTAGAADSAGAVATAAADPGTCAVGAVYQNTVTAKLRRCIATNTWADVLTADSAGNYLIGATVHDAATSEPTCDSSKRGHIVRVQGGTGVADTYRQCIKGAADTYAWAAFGSGGGLPANCSDVAGDIVCAGPIKASAFEGTAGVITQIGPLVEATIAGTGAGTLSSITPTAKLMVPVSDGLTAADCTTGGGTNHHWCVADGAAWSVAPNTATGTAGGDLSGTYPNPTVAKVNGNTPGNTCTNQFTRSIDSSGRGTCAAIAAADVAAAHIPYVIGSGALALNTTSIASANHNVTTVAQTGVLTTDTIIATVNGALIGVTGYVPATAGTLGIYCYPTAGNVNCDVVNNTAGAITPGAVTVNWVVLRVQ